MVRSAGTDAISLRIFSMDGRLAADLTDKISRGQRIAVWSVSGFPSGVYAVRFAAGGRVWQVRAVVAK
jgi:hypothetical protein